MKVKWIILMFHLLYSCSMCNSSTPKTTNGLHAEIPNEIPRIEKKDKITLPGLIAIICIVIIIIITILYCTIKKYCYINRHSASLQVSQTLVRECFSTTDTSTSNTTYPVIGYNPSWAPPAYPYMDRDLSQPACTDVLPPRYSSIFDDNGQEILRDNHE